MQALEEFQIREGEGSRFAATLIATPADDDCNESIQWTGCIRFDNDAYNWPHEFPKYEGGMFIMYEDWVYPRTLSSGAHCMNMLEKWHGEITAFIQRIQAAKS